MSESFTGRAQRVAAMVALVCMIATQVAPTYAQQPAPCDPKTAPPGGCVPGPRSPFETRTRLEKEFIERLSKPNPSPAMQMAREVLELRRLSEDPKYKDKFDREALDTVLERVMGFPAIQDEINQIMAGIRRDALNPSTEMGKAYRKHLEYMMSDDFYQRYRKADPTAANAMLAEELAKVQQIDPTATKAILDHIAERIAVDNLAEMSEDEIAANLQALDALAQADPEFAKRLVDFKNQDWVKTAKAPADVAKRLAKFAKEASAAAGKQGDDGMNAFTKWTVGKDNRLVKRIVAADSHGRVSSVAAILGIVGAATEGGYFKNGYSPDTWTKKELSLLATALKTADAFEAFGKAVMWARGYELKEITSTKNGGKVISATWIRPAVGGAPPQVLGKVGDATKFAKTAKFLKFAGPLADFIGAGIDGAKAFESFSNGKPLAGVLDGGASVCGVISGVGTGILFLEGMGVLGATGVGAPLALIGTIGWLGFKGVKWLTSEDEEIELMRKWGVHKAENVAKAKERQRVINDYRAYANSCTSDRCNTPGPVGDDARRVLGRDDDTIRMAKADPTNWRKNAYGGYDWVGTGPRPSPYDDLFKGLGGTGGPKVRPFPALPPMGEYPVAPGKTLTPSDKALLDRWSPGRPGRGKGGPAEYGDLEAAVKKLDPKSALVQSFIKDPVTCGGCH